ncbi:MAG: hypothetical protein ACRYFK_02415 [Janthinobacterium lividum]
MQENKGFIIVCCLLWASVFTILGLGNNSDIGFVLTLFLLPATLIGLIILFVIAVIRLFLRTQLPLAKRAVPLWFSTVPVLAYCIIGFGLQEIRKENTWLTIKQYDFKGAENFQFMKNGTYTQWRESPLGSSAKGNGRYEHQDSILTLHPDLKEGTSQIFKLAIRPYSEFKRQQSSPHLILVTLDTTVRNY